jgi:hypothetical protein
MGQKGGQSDLAAFLVDRGGLRGGDLVLAQAVAASWGLTNKA